MPAHILVVEDNFDNRKLVTWILEDEGYDVSCAETAEEGLEMLQNSDIAMILMDISLPGIDGKEATRRIRAMSQYANLPIIALTAHAIKGEHESIMESGVTSLITKPVDEELLTAKIAELLMV